MRICLPCAVDVDDRAGDLHLGVGGHDGAGEELGVLGGGAERACTAGMAATTFSAGKGTPMMPVEEGKTSLALHWKVSAAAVQVAMQASMPAAPVAQLAFPALTSTVATRPPVAARCRRPDGDRSGDELVAW